MKWIKSRNSFLNEAKLRDVILPRQAKEVKSTWGEQYLDQEEITPTDKIKQGTWVLTEEDKRKVLGAFFDVNMDKLYELFQNLPDKFCEILKLSINTDLLTDERKKFISVLNRFEIKSPSVDEIYLLYENVFRKLAVGETKATEVIQRDERGRPILGEDKKPVKITKEAGVPVFTNNLVNINSFLADYNSCYPEQKVDESTFTSGVAFNIRNAAGEDFSENDYEIDFEIFKRDLVLQILHKPSDILNMSISKFFASCQHLYSGGWRSQVLSNVFVVDVKPSILLTCILQRGSWSAIFSPSHKIGVSNFKKAGMEFGSTQDWKDTVISPKANIKEVIVETTNIPENMLEFPFDLNWIKFKFLKINHLDIFKFKTQAYAFDKCRFAEGLVEEIKNSNPGLKKLSFISCDIPKLDLSPFADLDELELVYTLDAGDKLEDVIKSTRVKTLRLSGDVLSEKENKKFIQDLKKSGTKVEVVGLVI